MRRPERIGFASALWLAVCSCGSLETSAPRECLATNAAIDEYLGQIAGLVSNRSKGSYALRRHERVVFSFALASDGSASDFRVARAPRPEAGAEALRAAQQAAPFPRPPFEPIACLVGGRAEIEMISFAGCDEALTSEYIDRMATGIQDAVHDAELQAPGEPDSVGLRIQVARDGTAAISVTTAPTPELGLQVAAIAQKLAPFSAPHESITECVVDEPSFVWIGLPGQTRQPVRLR